MFEVKLNNPVKIEKRNTEAAIALTRPNLSLAQPPKIPPIPIPKIVTVPSIPASTLVNPKSAVILDRLRESIITSAPSTTKARKHKKNANFHFLLPLPSPATVATCIQFSFANNQFSFHLNIHVSCEYYLFFT
ncbi:hypothetical protein D3C80_1529920 [compost metagenome]